MMSNIDKMITQYNTRKNMYEQYTTYLESLLTALIEESDIHYHTISGRTKSERSLYEKLKKGTHKYKTLDDITDIVGVRIVTHFASDVSEIAELIEREFQIDRENSVDKRKQMEVNQFGYMSLHYVAELDPKGLDSDEYDDVTGVKAEIQICSILQHAWAEIEHDFGYKVEKQVPWEVRRAFSRIASLLETADLEFDRIRNRMKEDVKNEDE